MFSFDNHHSIHSPIDNLIPSEQDTHLSSVVAIGSICDERDSSLYLILIDRVGRATAIESRFFSILRNRSHLERNCPREINTFCSMSFFQVPIAMIRCIEQFNE